jgi:O-acetyl-ADP-ribose deacetylase
MVKAMLGDITTFEGDAIVNAANEELRGGRGVDGAIHKAAGPGLLRECLTLGGCPTGEARVTGGHRLPARHVIHTVGPVWKGGDAGEPELLASCYRASLAICLEREFATVAFPGISIGIFGYPLEPATEIAIREVRRHMESNAFPREVTFVCFSEPVLEAYRQGLAPGRG